MTSGWWNRFHTVANWWRPDLPLDNHPPVFAECQGPQDPCCGLCRYSSHGCAGKPRRPTQP